MLGMLRGWVNRMGVYKEGVLIGRGCTCFIAEEYFRVEDLVDSIATRCILAAVIHQSSSVCVYVCVGWGGGGGGYG